MTATTSERSWPDNRDGATTLPTERFDVVAERFATAGVAVLIVTGFAASYTTLRDLAVAVGSFPVWLAPVVPLSFDVGIVVLSLKVVLAARQGRTATTLRVLVLVLSLSTVAANGASSVGFVGKLLHAVPSAMFVVCFESVVASARRQAMQRRKTPSGSDPRFGRARWLLAPRTTWTAWRNHVLATPTVSATHADPVRELTSAASGHVAESTEPWRGVRSERKESVTQDDQGPSPRTTLAKDERITLAAAIVNERPDITAADLAAELADRGQAVSVRTAQRVRNEAQRRLAAGSAFSTVDGTALPDDQGG